MDEGRDIQPKLCHLYTAVRTRNPEVWARTLRSSQWQPLSTMKATGNHLIKVHFPGTRLGAVPIVSAKPGIEYAMKCFSHTQIGVCIFNLSCLHE